MTRVLVIEAAGNLWGSERALLDLLQGLKTVKVAVCCPPGRPLIAELDKLHIRQLPYYVYGLDRKSRWHRLRAALGIVYACLKFRPQVIYLNQSGSYKISLLAATILHLPIVSHVRIFEDARYLAQQGPGPRRLRALIAISAAVEQEIRQYSTLDSIDVHCIHDAYAPRSQPGGSQARDARIACVGRVVPIKGHDVLIGALGLLKPVVPELKCLIVGAGERAFIRALEHKAQDTGATELLEWLGFHEDVETLLGTCSVLVCPSHREPLGRVIFEAWHAGAVPIVFAGSGGAAEIVAASRGGLIYDEQTPEALAGALHDALALGEDARARLIENGRSWMRSHCDPIEYGKAIADILASAPLWQHQRSTDAAPARKT
jgi:glycosyltransferase involved in cell wall biosynthesis